MTSDQPISADSLADARNTPGVNAIHVDDQAGRPSSIKVPAGTTARYVRIQNGGQRRSRLNDTDAMQLPVL